MNTSKIRLWIAQKKYMYRKSRRLRRIEKAIGIKLRPDQRAVVMSDDYPDFYGWERHSGKTVAACMWTLLNRSREIVIERELAKLNPGRAASIKFHDRVKAVPDPDADTMQRYISTLSVLRDMKIKCAAHGIQVCDVRVMHQYPNRGGSGWRIM